MLKMRCPDILMLSWPNMLRLRINSPSFLLLFLCCLMMFAGFFSMYLLLWLVGGVGGRIRFRFLSLIGWGDGFLVMRDNPITTIAAAIHFTIAVRVWCSVGYRNVSMTSSWHGSSKQLLLTCLLFSLNLNHNNYNLIRRTLTQRK